MTDLTIAKLELDLSFFYLLPSLAFCFEPVPLIQIKEFCALQ